MKTKKSMKVLALALSLIMLLTACGQNSGSQGSSASGQKESTTSSSAGSAAVNESSAESEESVWPEYLNMDSTYPVIKEGYEDSVKKLRVAIVMYSNAGEWEDLWVSRFLKDKYNIELEVEYIMDTALSERKNLMMNSGDLPDLMWNMYFTTDELNRYGAGEGLFLACDEYISEELTPNLCSYLTDDVLSAITTPDGHIYSLPNIKDATENTLSYNRFFVNGEYLEAAGIEAPRTLDEFTEAMYKLKEADVTGVGSENFYPIGGGMEVKSSTPYLLNAFGYNCSNNNYYGFDPVLRDGEVVIPVYDMEVYKEFLALMNQYYKDGIINPNFFTIETTESNAQLHNRQTAVYGEVVYTTGLETWSEWDACYPLTSAWQEEPQAYTTVPLYIGGYVISADTEYPELCMRLADIFYDESDCRGFWGGTGEGSEYDYDGFTLAEYHNGNWGINAAKLPEGYTSGWTYAIERLFGYMFQFGSYNTREAIVNMAANNGADLAYDVRETYDVVGNSDHQWRQEMWDKVMDYVEYGYPTIYYVSEETSNKIMDLETLIEPYVKEQVALFITGGRDLSEVDDFVKELETMGMDELLQIYQDIYSNTQ